MKKIIISLLFLGVFVNASGQSADIAIGEVLRSVELNNAGLAAQRHLTDARTLEARTGNSLENPEVEFLHKWGDPSPLGKAGELTLTQSFDFPTTYTYRNRMARDLAAQYGYEYAAGRQQVLFEAQSLCLEIIALRKQNDILRQAYENARNIADVMSRREQAGDANILESNKAKFELVGAKNAYDLNVIELSAAMIRLENLNGGKPLAFAAEVFPDRPLLADKEAMLRRYEDMSPALLALVSEKNAADNDVRLSRSMSMPKFKAGYKHEFATGNERFNGVVVGMSIPMFGNRHNVKRAKAQSVFAESSYRSALLDMWADIAELYAKAELLGTALEEYRAITEQVRSVGLLNKAIEAGQISVVDYFSELAPIFSAALTMIEVERDYHLVCARIMVIDL